ncbi:MAG: zinc-ribbon domain-containing protein [Spirochaetes bacterium]|nr:zinc-ribbon domain-containing protein [Spirochaetota bacterium]
MIVKCSDCNASFSVDDAKISGKKFAFDCPSCSHHNIIDNRETAAPAVMPAFDSVKEFSDDELVDNSNAMVADEFEFDDEIEPEIDLSVLNRPAQTADDDAIIDDDSASEPIKLDDDSDDLDFDDLDLPEEFSTGKEENMGSLSAGNDSAFMDTDDFNPVESDEPDAFSGLDLSDETGEPESDDDSTTIDLDSLDIDLDGLDEAAEDEPGLTAAGDESGIENDDLTLDLASLDINLEESDEIKSGENLDDSADDRLSLEDAGLSLDEISADDQMIIEDETETEDELRLSIDEIPGLNVDELASSGNDDFPEADETEDELRLSIDEIPGLNVDELAASAAEDEADVFENSTMEFDEIPEMDDGSSDNLIIDEFRESNLPEVDMEKYEAGPLIKDPDIFDIDMEDIDDYIEDNFDHSGKGYINFSIDYSLKFSRMKAFLRLIGLYYIVFIPHFIVLYIYNALSMITGCLNWILILFSGKGERDFYAIQEKTLRYNLSFSGSVFNVIEDNPRFAGNTGLDDTLQMKAALPENPSRFLAAMRLSGIGIMFLSLPHIVLLSILSSGMILIWFIGLISVIVSGKWPNILFDFMVRYLRYAGNVCAYLSGLSDSYPSFRFD